jgi:hypothetical protein
MPIFVPIAAPECSAPSASNRRMAARVVMRGFYIKGEG